MHQVGPENARLEIYEVELQTLSVFLNRYGTQADRIERPGHVRLRKSSSVQTSRPASCALFGVGRSANAFIGML